MGSWNPRANEIFLRALEIPAPERRRAYVAEACGGDSGLAAEVEVLLVADERAGSFLASPAAALVSEPTPLAEGPGAVIGPYQLLEPIGEGGFGVVFLAEQERPVRRRVALKVIRPGMDTRQVVARFEAERQALALMDHPNIARVLDAGTTGSGRPYFVMELVEGVPITRFCDERRLTPRERLELLLPVCRAVQHAHQKGVIHRDIKPSNVVVALYDGRPVPKVIDFGVAKATGPSLTERTLATELGTVVGTLEYMSPEQAQLDQLDVDTRSDIYSLGVLLYELLTGTTPLDRGRLKRAVLLDVLRSIREEDPPRPSTRLSTAEGLPGIAADRGLEPMKLSRLVRGELDWIVMKCLEKDRARRYQTADGLARDLERYLRDEPVEAGPPGAGYRLRKIVHRHRAEALLAAAFVALLVVAAVVSLWQAVRATGAERRARRNERQALMAAEAESRARHAEAAQRRQAEEVAGFLESVLKGQDPMHMKVALDRRLDAVAAELEEERAGEPLVRARLRYALAFTLMGLGKYDRAVRLLDLALAGRRRHLGPAHPETLTTQDQLGYAYHAAGRVDEALPLFEGALERRRALLGPDHPDTLASLHNVAYAYHAAGRLDDALPLYQQALEGRKARLGPDHPDTLHSMTNLAYAYQAAGRSDEALSLYRRALERQEARLGPDHPLTLSTLNYLACMYRDTGRLGEALPLLEQGQEKLKARFGPDHPRTLFALVHLARAYQAAGRLDEALRRFERAAETFEAQLGPDHPGTLSTKDHLARAYAAAGEPGRAESLAREALARHRQKGGPGTIAAALATLGEILLSRADYAGAEPPLRECLALRLKQKSDDWTTDHARSLLGVALTGRGDHAAAEPLLVEGYEGMSRRAAGIPPHLRAARLDEALERLAQLYEAWGKDDVAAEWRAKLPRRDPGDANGSSRVRNSGR